MTEKNEGIPPLRLVSMNGLSEMFWPTPKERREDAVDTPLLVGDLVEILIGPAIGKTGVVVVDRNSNYVDYQVDAGKDSIGVQVLQELDASDPITSALLQSGLVPPTTPMESETRWFDHAGQLNLVFGDRPTASE